MFPTACPCTRELTLEAVATGALVEQQGVWLASGPIPTPSSLRELVELRTGELDQTATKAAEHLAVAESLGLADLLSVAGRSAVESLEGAGIVVVESEGARRVARFVHPLYGEVIRQEMPTTRLMATSARLADMFEQRDMTRAEDVVRVASWRLASDSHGDPELLATAAEEAYRSGSFELAERLALPAAEGGVAPAGLLLAQIYHERGDHDAAEELNSAIDLGGLDPGQRQRAAVQRAVNLFFGLGRGADALAVLENKGDAVNRAWILLNMGRVAEASVLVGEATGDRDGVAAVVTAAWVAALGGRPGQTLELTEQARRLSPARPLLPSRFRDFPDIPEAMARLETGDIAGAENLSRHGLEASLERHPAFIRAWWLFLLGRVALDRGLLRTAARHFQAGAALQRTMSQPGLLQWHLAGAALALAQSDHPDHAVPLLEECAAIGDRDERLFTPLLSLARAWLTARGGDAAGASAVLVTQGDALAEEGALTLARRLWFDAARMADPTEVVNRLEDGDSPLDRRRHALVSARDAADLAAAAEGFEAMGLHLWAAEAWAGASVAYRRERDQRRATAARLASERARGECEQADTPGLVVEASVSPLTDREREVVALAARGTPSKEIAEALFISVRTVNNLIQRAYVKLGVSSRAEAAVALGISGE